MARAASVTVVGATTMRNSPRSLACAACIAPTTAMVANGTASRVFALTTVPVISRFCACRTDAAQRDSTAYHEPLDITPPGRAGHVGRTMRRSERGTPSRYGGARTRMQTADRRGILCGEIRTEISETGCLVKAGPSR